MISLVEVASVYHTNNPERQLSWDAKRRFQQLWPTMSMSQMLILMELAGDTALYEDNQPVCKAVHVDRALVHVQQGTVSEARAQHSANTAAMFARLGLGWVPNHAGGYVEITGLAGDASSC